RVQGTESEAAQFPRSGLHADAHGRAAPRADPQGQGRHAALGEPALRGRDPGGPQARPRARHEALKPRWSRTPAGALARAARGESVILDGAEGGVYLSPAHYLANCWRS